MLRFFGSNSLLWRSFRCVVETFVGYNYLPHVRVMNLLPERNWATMLIKNVVIMTSPPNRFGVRIIVGDGRITFLSIQVSRKGCSQQLLVFGIVMELWLLASSFGCLSSMQRCYRRLFRCCCKLLVYKCNAGVFKTLNFTTWFTANQENSKVCNQWMTSSGVSIPQHLYDFSVFFFQFSLSAQLTIWHFMFYPVAFYVTSASVVKSCFIVNLMSMQRWL